MDKAVHRYQHGTKNKNGFEKDFSRLINHSIFGKTIKNLRKHRNIKLVTTDRRRSHLHCVKSVRIRSYSGPYFPTFELNTDQNNSEYGHFLRSASAVD